MTAKIVAAVVAIGAVSYLLITFVQQCPPKTAQYVSTKYTPTLTRRSTLEHTPLTLVHSVSGGSGERVQAVEDNEQNKPAQPVDVKDDSTAQVGGEMPTIAKPMITEEQEKLHAAYEEQYKKHTAPFEIQRFSQTERGHGTGPQNIWPTEILKQDMLEIVKNTQYDGFACTVENQGSESN